MDIDPLEMGTGFALAGVLTDQVRESIERNNGEVRLASLFEQEIPFTNAADQPYEVFVEDWDSYVGQEPMKEQLRVAITSANARYAALDHILLASGTPGVGKTTLARLIAQEFDTRLTMLVPPFTQQTLYDAAMQMDDGEFLFIDEIHKLADGGPRAAENLLHMMEERVIYLPDGPRKLADFTVIGATTDRDKLPETIIDRFMIKPYFQPYSLKELVQITHNFVKHYRFFMLPETIVGIAKACRGIPRVSRELVIAARDLTIALGRTVKIEEVLAFKEVDPDGMTRVHKAYVATMFKHFGRVSKSGEREYVAGEASMMSVLRETKQGVQRLERFLIEQGLLDRTPSGRKLTPAGIRKAESYVREGVV